MTDRVPRNPALLQPASYRFWTDLLLRHSDCDEQVHVNNTTQAGFCEEGRRAFLSAFVAPHAEPGDLLMMAGYTINYLREIRFPGTVRIGTTVLACGTSSLRLAQGLFVGEVCHTACEATLVLADSLTRKSKPLPAAARLAIAPHLFPAES